MLSLQAKKQIKVDMFWKNQNIYHKLLEKYNFFLAQNLNFKAVGATFCQTVQYTTGNLQN